MFSHVMVGSNDIERSKRFYDAVLGVLGAGEAMENRNAAGQMRLFYRHGGSSFCVTEPIDGEPATFANGGTIGHRHDLDRINWKSSLGQSNRQAAMDSLR